MATTRKQATSPNKTAAAKAPAQDAADSGLKAAELIAERYRDAALGGLVGPKGEDITAVMSAGEAILAGMAEVSQEVVDFAGSRLRQDMESAEDLATAKTPEEIFQKQCLIAKRAAEQYVEETGKLIGMMARIQQHCWAPVEERTKAALHDINATDDAAEK